MTTTDREAGPQLRRGAGRAARPRPRAGPGRAARLRRHRHVGDGDEPPLGRLRGHHPEGRGRPALAARARPDHAVLFLQGGATLQFAMVPMNLRAAGASADYVLTGHWSKAALKEAQKSGRARVAGSTEASALRPRAGPGRARPRPPGGLPALHLEQHDLRHAVVDRPRSRRPACRWCATRPPTPSAGPSTSRATA